MRSQASNTGQPSGSNDQKKSVFDRLGRQLDTGRPAMKRRPSPGQYGDYMPPPPPSAHEPEFVRYGPRDPHSQAEMEWRYQNERRHMGGPYPPRDGRHAGQMPSGPPQQLPPPGPPPPSHYEMERANGGRPPPYFQNPYHNVPPQGPPPPPPMGPGNMMMTMHQQRSSPKYDRHGNMIVGFKDRNGPPMRGPGPMDHHHGMSPSRGFMPPGPPMMHPGGPHDMQQGMRPPVGMYPPPRWPEAIEPEFPPPHAMGRLMQDDRFSPVSSRRYQQQQQQQQQQMMNPQSVAGHPNPCGEFPRYTKWRERRDVITNLDKETAQSSSRTDSLKSTLQQPDNRGASIRDLQIDDMKQSRGKQQKAETAAQKEPKTQTDYGTTAGQTDKDSSTKVSPKPTDASKGEPQEISDGEIVDDEDSSDDSETVRVPTEIGRDLLASRSYLSRSKNLPPSSYAGRNRESHAYYDSNNKKRRLLERDDYSMDYETISDEDLDDFMGDKKDLDPEEAKLSARLGDEECKSLSEIELLNALGLDWANLVEMAKQSKATGKENSTQSSALPRFSMTNYLPTLGIDPELVGTEIYDLVLRVCRP